MHFLILFSTILYCYRNKKSSANNGHPIAISCLLRSREYWILSARGRNAPVSPSVSPSARHLPGRAFLKEVRLFLH